MHFLTSRVLAAFLLTLGAACGEKAQNPGPEGGGADASMAQPEGHGDDSATADTADTARVRSRRWDGTVRLRGGLAQAGEGFLFVNIKPEGVAMPSYSVKVALSTGQAEGDEFVVPFEITEANTMGGLVDGIDLVLEACYDSDGFVESKEGQVRHSIPVEVDQLGVEIVLEN